MAAAASTTKAQQNSMLPSPCSDRWNWPTPLFKMWRTPTGPEYRLVGCGGVPGHESGADVPYVTPKRHGAMPVGRVQRDAPPLSRAPRAPPP